MAVGPVNRGELWHGRSCGLRAARGVSPVRARLAAMSPDDHPHQDEADLRFEHDPACRTLPGLFRELAVHYPGLDEGETVTLCHFFFDGAGEHPSAPADPGRPPGGHG